jgi:excisionase family DNA binding protein
MSMSLRVGLLDTGAVSRWLGVSRRTVCFWAECDEIPGIKVGRAWRFREEDIEGWLEKKRRMNASTVPEGFDSRPSGGREKRSESDC